MESNITIPFAAVLLFLAVYDIRTRRIPDAVTLPGIVIAFAVTWDVGHFAAALLFGGLFLVLAMYSGGIGGGDIKMAALVGAMVGYPLVYPAMVITALAGGVTALALVALKRRTMRDSLPYGPFLAIGGIVALVMEGM